MILNWTFSIAWWRHLLASSSLRCLNPRYPELYHVLAMLDLCRLLSGWPRSFSLTSARCGARAKASG